MAKSSSPRTAASFEVLKAGGDQELIAANNLDEDIFATPAIADGRIYVRTVARAVLFRSEMKAL